MSITRRVAEGMQRQGEDEKIHYGLVTTEWGSSPTSIVVTVKDVTNPNVTTDVTGTVTTGSSTANGDTITLPLLHSLTKNHKYRMEIRFTDDNNNTWEPYAEIWCEE